MDGAAVVYLVVTFGLFAVFAAIVIQTYRRRNRDRLESPRHRMLEDDD